jgi:hypothetical protein
MKNRRLIRLATDTAIVAGLFTFAFSRPAYAYIDPGSASVVITAILGAFAAVSYSARMYLARIKKLFTKRGQDSRK